MSGHLVADVTRYLQCLTDARYVRLGDKVETPGSGVGNQPSLNESGEVVRLNAEARGKHPRRVVGLVHRRPPLSGRCTCNVQLRASSQEMARRELAANWRQIGGESQAGP